MRSLNPGELTLTDAFWGERQTVVLRTTLPTMYAQIVETGRLRNLERAAKRESGDFQGIYFNDSDVYKYLEACAYALGSPAAAQDPESADQVRRQADSVIAAIEAAQMDDGYLHSYFQLMHPDKRWVNLHAMHEMYCAGHMIEAAVAWHTCAADDRLLRVAVKLADHIASVFGPGKRLGTCGHEEIELALIRLAEATGNAAYGELGKWFVEIRGSRPSPFAAEIADPDVRALNVWSSNLWLKNGEYDGQYAQDHAPIREHTDVVGHAVRAMYLYIAAAEIAGSANDEALEIALERCWASVTKRRMYVTGGIGPSASNEGFTADFDLPNLSAYAETCAAIGLALWANAYLQQTADTEYADVMERALYNGSISGLSLSGDRYFYDNPLESRGNHHRVPWFDCACCPPNIARLIGRIGDLALGTSENAFFVNIPVAFEAKVQLGEATVSLKMESNYPWSGEATLHVNPASPAEFAICIRLPGWAEDVSAEAPGEAEADYEKGYIVYRRRWSAGDVVKLDFGVEPTWVQADPRVRENAGRVALMRGPMVYCAESLDLDFEPQMLTVDTGAEFEEASVHGLSVPCVKVQGHREIQPEADELYYPLGEIESHEVKVPFVPYFAWNNRGKSFMQVWVRGM
jgi:DUF1680 family protein